MEDQISANRIIGKASVYNSDGSDSHLYICNLYMEVSCVYLEPLEYTNWGNYFVRLAFGCTLNLAILQRRFRCSDFSHIRVLVIGTLLRISVV